MSAKKGNGLGQYVSSRAVGGVTDASPHKLIEMLLSGALEKIRLAKSAMQQDLVVVKLNAISDAIAILEGLILSLDTEQGGELANNLGSLYEYIGKRLVDANSTNDAAKLDECVKLLNEIKSAWDEIPALLAKQGASQGSVAARSAA